MTKDRIRDTLLHVFRDRWHVSLPAITLMAAILLAAPKGAPNPDQADSIQYLSAAYHLAQHGVFAESPMAGPVAPGLGREPGYGAFLSLFMRFDPLLAGYDPTCLVAKPRCPTEVYRHAAWANSIFIALTGAVTFLCAWTLSGSLLAGWVSGCHIWLNHTMAKGREYMVSDPMSMFLAALAGLSAIWAARRRRPVAWVVPALLLAALTLTKAVFLYLVVPGSLVMLGWVLVRGHDRRHALAALALFALAYALPVGGWMARNADISGRAAISSGRTAIAINTRVVFNDMSPAQYAAAFVYWTRGFGDGLARRLFDEKVWGPFELYRPSGFYMTGQFGLAPRMGRLMREEGLDAAAAEARLARQLQESILANLPVHLLTTVPLFYRGIWLDEFIVLSLPALFWFAYLALRRRDGALLAVLAIGCFSLTFYALFSLNIPRYQMTAIPTLSVALGLAAWRFRERRLGMKDGDTWQRQTYAR